MHIIFKYGLTLLAILLTLGTVSCRHGSTSAGMVDGDSVNWADSASQRYNRVLGYYNNNEHDSLLMQAQADMVFDSLHGAWWRYYQTWQKVAEEYCFTGDIQQCLNTADEMMRHAMRRGDVYGQATANYVMGVAYLMMGNHVEGIRCFETAESFLGNSQQDNNLLSMVWTYHARALDREGRYESFDSLLTVWRVRLSDIQALDSISQEKLNSRKKHFFMAKFAYDSSMKHYKLAYADVDSIERYVGDNMLDRHDMVVYRFEIAMAKGDMVAANRYSEQDVEMASHLDKGNYVSALDRLQWMLETNQRYEEAFLVMKEMYLIRDSINTAQTTEQLNELNKRFEVDQLKAQQERDKIEHERSRLMLILIIVAVVVVALLLFIVFYHRLNRRLEQKNQQLEHEHRLVSERNRELAVERDRVQAAYKAKEAFMQSMTHEIRTPLNAISGFTQVLTMPGMELGADEQREFSMKIQENTQQLTEILNDLIEITDMESSTDLPPAEEYPVAVLCGQAADTVRPRLQPGVELKTVCEVSDELVLNTHPQLILTALDKLLDNAAKFTKEGSITLSLLPIPSGEGDRLLFSVTDTGPGIPEDKKDFVFERFAKLDSFVHGAGLGLSVARMIAQRLGGSLTLDTSYTDGTKMDFIIPTE